MTIFDRFSIRLVAAGAGLCGAALVFSPDVTASPLIAGGGYACMEGAAGQAGGAPVGAGCSPAAAPVADMAGVPMALPGPVPMAPPVPVVPLVPPLPALPVVPAGAPLGAPVAAPVAGGAGLVDMANGYAGKGDPILPAPPGAPVAGQPIPPGPSPAAGR
jgi:hypothetical protein